jgi:hypothetical protein
LADRYGFALKYGGGPVAVRDALLEYSDFAATVARVAADARAGTSDRKAIQRLREAMDRLPAYLETLSIE